jgi:hypothetical protein
MNARVADVLMVELKNPEVVLDGPIAERGEHYCLR